ncbi:hypothetical protein EW145_g1245 [Phellinidium pouzarii]|uniref:Phospholipid/glycerol acyltransferase domain-containing protein n=1 Tax=Phellinidium pouzarii TaxID=167371 RepID=A0A4S4LFF0_9AGAM|nr:hypothetical protein EW145_g1245 [Phellinidium pouzarii]
MNTSRQPYALPIADRPRKSWYQFAHGVVFLIVFLFGCIMINTTQLVFVLPLRLVPNARVRALYEEGVRYTKGSFGMLITLACQLFAPTTLRVTFETDGIGAFSLEEIENVVERDASGNIVRLCLPKKLVIIANHQHFYRRNRPGKMYADWWYVWCLTYFMDMHRDVLIVLKKSLKWVPVLGWGMQIFSFIFLARSWVSDKHYLVSKLAKLGRKAQQGDTPLAFIIYPEGTLVSKDTRPISKKYAEKMGISDMTHTLLPRSTGLHYALRALLPRVPNLKLLDITVAYPGIPPMGYVHMHLRLLDVTSEVPIGDLSATNAAVMPSSRSNSSSNSNSNSNSMSSSNGHASSDPGSAEDKARERQNVVETDVPESERVVFDEWLRKLWRIKDSKLEEFHQSGSEAEDSKYMTKCEDGEEKRFASGSTAIEIPLKLRNTRDVLDSFCFFSPAVVGWIWGRIKG